MVGWIRACDMSEEVGPAPAPNDASAYDGACPGSRSLWSEAGKRFGRDTKAVLASGLVVLIALLAIAGPLLSPYGYDALDWHHLAVPPGLQASHWLGTDRLGRDLFVRTLYGVRISLVIGVLATLVSVVIGLAWGSIAGYLGGRTDDLMMRCVDVLYALPYLFLVIVFATFFGRGSLVGLFLVIGAVGWLTTARIVRGQTLALKRREFIEAARATGVGTPGILLRHVIPNLIGPVALYATLTIPDMILFESFLSFLGLGVQEPLASLGSLINGGAQEMQSAPWMLLVPALVLSVLLLCFNLIGDALRDALDPSSER
jgi:oligopeptide transport system permease protein